MRALPERLLRFYQSATGKKETRISRIAMPHNEACSFWRGMGDRIGAVRAAKHLWFRYDSSRSVSRRTFAGLSFRVGQIERRLFFSNRKPYASDVGQHFILSFA